MWMALPNHFVSRTGSYILLYISCGVLNMAISMMLVKVQGSLMKGVAKWPKTFLYAGILTH